MRDLLVLFLTLYIGGVVFISAILDAKQRSKYRQDLMHKPKRRRRELWA